MRRCGFLLNRAISLPRGHDGSISMKRTSRIIAACVNQGDSDRAVRIFKVVEKETLPSLSMYNTLLSVHQHNDDLAQLECEFKRMPRRNAFSYLAYFQATARHHHKITDEMWTYFQAIDFPSIAHQESRVSQLFVQLLKVASPPQVPEIWDKVKSLGPAFSANQVILSARLRAQAKDPLCDIAGAVVEAMEHVNGAAATEEFASVVMTVLANDGANEEAWQFYQSHEDAFDSDSVAAQIGVSQAIKSAPCIETATKLLEDHPSSVRTDPIAYESLLLAAQRLGSSFDVYKFAKDNEIELNPRFFNIMAEMAPFDDVIKVCHQPVPCEVYNNAIRRHRHRGNSAAALHVWDKLLDSPVVPNERSFWEALQSCQLKSQHNVYGISSRIGDVIAQLKAHESQFSTDQRARIHSGIGRVFGRAGHHHAAMDIYKEVFRMAPPSPQTVNSAITVMSWHPETAARIGKLLERFGPEIITRDTYHHWISSCCMPEGEPAKMFEIYDLMVASGVRPTVQTFDQMLHVCSTYLSSMVEQQEADWTRVISLWSSELGEPKFTAKEMNILLSSVRNKQGTEDMFWETFQSMKDSDDSEMHPSGHTFHIVVKKLVRSGSLPAAAKFLQGEHEESLERGRPEPWDVTHEMLVAAMVCLEQFSLAVQHRQWAQENCPRLSVAHVEIEGWE